MFQIIRLLLSSGEISSRSPSSYDRGYMAGEVIVHLLQDLLRVIGLVALLDEPFEVTELQIPFTSFGSAYPLLIPPRSR